MNRPEIDLNAADLLGDILKRSGVNKVNICFDSHANEDQAYVIVSPKIFSAIQKEFEKKEQFEKMRNR